ANTTYRFAIQGPPFNPFYAPALSTHNFYTSGGVEVYTHNNPNSPGYGGNYLSPGNTPRGWVGMVSFVPSNACATPVAGSASSSRTWICAGDNFTLDLPNATLGSG